MGTAPLIRVHGIFYIFTVATLVTEVLFEQFLTCTSMQWVEHSCQRCIMNITISDDLYTGVCSTITLMQFTRQYFAKNVKLVYKNFSNRVGMIVD